MQNNTAYPPGHGRANGWKDGQPAHPWTMAEQSAYWMDGMTRSLSHTPARRRRSPMPQQASRPLLPGAPEEGAAPCPMPHAPRPMHKPPMPGAPQEVGRGTRGLSSACRASRILCVFSRSFCAYLLMPSQHRNRHVSAA